jgi:hypothetical protein
MVLNVKTADASRYIEHLHTECGMAQLSVDNGLCSGAFGICLSLTSLARASWRHSHQHRSIMLGALCSCGRDLTVAAVTLRTVTSNE